MNWEAIGAMGEVGGTLAVLVTLVYLSIQIRHVKRQALVASYQHSFDLQAEFTSLLASSESLASIVVRGRASYSSLEPDEQLRFDHLYATLLNSMESAHFQLIETSDPGRYREEHLRNFGEVIHKYCDYPGFKQYWLGWSSLYPAEIRALVEKNVGAA